MAIESIESKLLINRRGYVLSSSLKIRYGTLLVICLIVTGVILVLTIPASGAAQSADSDSYSFDSLPTQCNYTLDSIRGHVFPIPVGWHLSQVTVDTTSITTEPKVRFVYNDPHSVTWIEVDPDRREIDSLFHFSPDSGQRVSGRVAKGDEWAPQFLMDRIVWGDGPVTNSALLSKATSGEC